MPPSTAHEIVADPYAVVAHGLQQWRQRPGDAEAVEAVLAGLLRLKLGGIAQRVVAAAGVTSPEWLERIRQSAAGKVSWSSRRRRFQANLAALAGHDVDVRGLQTAWDQAAERYEFYLALDGNAFVLDTQAADPLAAVLGGLIDHRAAAAACALPANTSPLIPPFGFDGTGYGWMLSRVLEMSHESYLTYSCPVYIVEPDVAAFCMLLHMQDWQRWFASSRLRLFVGDHAVERFSEALRKHHDWTLPQVFLDDRLTVRPALSLNRVAEQLHSGRIQEKSRFIAENNAWYADKTPAYWAQRFATADGNEPPLKVLGITTRFSTVLQYSMREFGEAIRAAGHEFILSMESDDQSIEQTFVELIHQHKPDLLVMISRMRYENPQLPMNMPALCWDQDGLACTRTPEATRSIGPLTYVAGHAAHHGFLNLGWPEESCIFFRAAGSTHRYSNSPAPTGQADRTCDFSYVSNASATPEDMLSEKVAAWKQYPDLQRFFAAAGETILARCREGNVWDGYLVDVFVRSEEAVKGISPAPAVHHEMVHQLRLISDRAYRHVALGWVADYCRKRGTSLRLIGRGWKSHPAFGRFAEDFVAPGEELRALYQSTKINLQIIESGFIHSRVLDGLSAGGFFMTRWAREARDHNGTGRLVHAMANRALQTNCLGNAQLRDSTDPIIRQGWTIMAQTMKAEELRPELPCKYLRQWAASPNEEVAFPQLDEVTFKDQESFNALADRYLGDAAARQAMAEEMRKIVVERFSYDACWRESQATIRRGLEKAAGIRT